MYLFIFEDGSMRTGNTITDDDFNASDNGILDIVKVVLVGMELHYEQYHDTGWQRIEAL